MGRRLVVEGGKAPVRGSQASSPTADAKGGTSDVRLKIDSRCDLGEAATWCSRSERLFWTDIDGAVLWIYDSRKDWSTSLPMPERLACLGLCKDPRYLLLGLATRLALYDTIGERMTTIVEIEPDLPTRLNDGRCDRQGRFVFGTKHDADPAEAIGGFYRLNTDLTLERLPLAACAIANGIAFSPDGGSMYYCDSPTRQIRVCDYPTFRKDRTFVRLDDEEGVPDGSTVDSEGGIWNARWDGACVVRYAPDGRETARIALPISKPTCVAFGGHALDTLYVTSARGGFDEGGHTKASAGEGGVFAVAPGISGIKEPLFGY